MSGGPSRPAPSVESWVLTALRCRDPLPGRGRCSADRAGRRPAGWRVIVVDNGSTDGTADVARALGAHVVTEARPGYGAAVHAGIARRRGRARRRDRRRRLDAVGRPRADAGARTFGGGDDGRRPTPSRRAAASGHGTRASGTQLLATWIRRRSAFPIHDLAPMRVCRRDDLLALGVEDRRFGYPLELMLRAARTGLDRAGARRRRTTAGPPGRSPRSPGRSAAPPWSCRTSPRCSDESTRRSSSSPRRPCRASPRRGSRATVGDAAAAELAAAALLDTLETVAAVGWPVVVAMTGDLGEAVRADEIAARAVGRTRHRPAWRRPGRATGARACGCRRRARRRAGRHGHPAADRAGLPRRRRRGARRHRGSWARRPTEAGGCSGLPEPGDAVVLADVGMSVDDTAEQTQRALGDVVRLRVVRDMDSWADASTSPTTSRCLGSRPSCRASR